MSKLNKTTKICYIHPITKYTSYYTENKVTLGIDDARFYNLEHQNNYMNCYRHMFQMTNYNLSNVTNWVMNI